MGFEQWNHPDSAAPSRRASCYINKFLPVPGAWNKVDWRMRRRIQESLLSLVGRFSGVLPSVWMLLVLLIFLAIRVLGAHSIQSLHLFGKAL